MLVVAAVIALLALLLAAPVRANDPMQYDALVAIYKATGGQSWTVSTGWLTDPNYCNWHGVTCIDTSGSVSAL